MILESHSLKTALARFHLTTPQTLRELQTEEEAKLAEAQVRVLQQQVSAIQEFDSADFADLARLALAIGDGGVAAASCGGRDERGGAYSLQKLPPLLGRQLPGSPRAGELEQVCERPARLTVVESDHAVIAARRHEAPVRAEIGGVDGPAGRAQDGDARAGRRLPDARGAVGAGRDDQLSVGRERDAVDRRDVAP